MNHGELFWVDLPNRAGREQSGRRPAVIWQDTAAFLLPIVLMILLSAKPDVFRFGGTVLIQPIRANGLASPSVALVFQLGACDVRRFGGRIGQLDGPDLVALGDLAKQLQKL